MERIVVDDGQKFDFGRTSKAYGKYRDIYPQSLYKRMLGLGIGKAGSHWLDLGTGSGVIPRAMAKYGARIVATDISENQIREAKELSANMDNIEYKVVSAEEINYPSGSFDAITACQCFWYFDPAVVVPKIRTMLKPDGIFLKVYMSYMKEEPITQDSNSIVKRINGSWSGASSALKDLSKHYFDDPHMEILEEELPFTRETWHGRMMASRGVMASMNSEQLELFDREHMAMLCEKYPEHFTVRHKLFLTWYTL